MNNNIEQNSNLRDVQQKKKQAMVIVVVGVIIGILLSVVIITNMEKSYSIKTSNGYETIKLKDSKIRFAISQLQKKGLAVGTYQAVAFRGKEVLAVRLIAWDDNHYTGSYYVYTVNLDTGNAILLDNYSYSRSLGTKEATELLAFDMGLSYKSNCGIIDF